MPRNNATILKNVISISANGANTGATFYQNKEFTVLQDAYAIKWIYTNDILTDNQHIFLTASISKAIYGNYEWTNKAGWEKIKGNKIPLPIKPNANLDKISQIDFEFMENFISQLEVLRISQLEAYLLFTGLKDYTLTTAEQQALVDFENSKVVWGEYNLEKLFGKSTRGKRLKSADRIAGDLPFVTAGEAETGVSAFIGNEVEIFKANTTTIDMFGSAKYRNYDYGGDDHIAVVHTEDLNKYAAIFMTSAIHKSSYTGKFSYARNFYAKDADELNIQLPTNNQQPDYSFMETLISAVQKLVIKDVVRYADNKIATTKQVISS
ncbi:restriction endonuclease subunit S [Muribacter muris]|uniref:restriction endonuclease subunit S n=1 Tax=Muribacter muris TaxID=67855 RepID=UPI000A05796F|nr:restriction endonuclease subunit S [Muribacter muris]